MATAEGILNAQSLRPIPEGLAVSVEPLDNSRENLRIQAEFERELTQQGYRVENGARLILTFETRDEIGSWSSGSRCSRRAAAAAEPAARTPSSAPASSTARKAVS